MRKKNIKFVLAAFFVGFCCISCTHNSASKQAAATDHELLGNISISGAFALYPLTIKWAEEFKILHPGVTIDISAGGAGKGMSDVLSDMVDVAMFSRDVAPIEVDKGAWTIAVAKDAVFPTVNTHNPLFPKIVAQGLTREQCKEIFTGQISSWDQLFPGTAPEPLHVYTRSDACGAAATWAKFFDLKQENLKGTGVFGDPGLADAVKKDIRGIGFNNLVYLYDGKTSQPVDGIVPIPLDLNENRTIDADEDFYGTMSRVMSAIQAGKYPSPPSRNLYLVTKRKPTNNIVLEFLKYVVTDGQNHVQPSGYVKLHNQELYEMRERLF